MFPKMQKPMFRMIAAGLACIACGCASVDFLKLKKDEFPVADAKNPVVQVLSMWQPTHGVGMDGKSTRGFAGQILFLTRDNPTPAKVNGTVRIYVFDDQGKPGEQAKPIHQFDFPGEAWNVQARISKLGLTYSVFIPYTRPGSHEAHCSLKVRFVPEEGQGHALYSEMCNVDLPGVNKKKIEEEIQGEPDEDDEYVRRAVKAGKEIGRGRVDLASYEEPAGGRSNRQAIEQLAAEAFRDANVKASTAQRKLPPEEEQRILREMQAQMGGKLSSHADARSVSQKVVRPRGRNPLEENRATWNDDDEEYDGPVYNRTAKRPVSRRQHVLDGETDDESELASDSEDDFPAASASSVKKGWSGRTSRQPARHPLDGDDAPETTRKNRKRREALSINLSELR